MNILWMTLIAGIGLTLASAMQYKDMGQDRWWQQVSRYYSLKKQELDHEYQRQEFHNIQRDIAYVGPQQEGFEKEKKDKEQDKSPPSFDHPRIHRIAFYPLNTRLPLSKRLYMESAQSQLWRAAYWRLSDLLYGKYAFYSTWRESIDPNAFLNELFEQTTIISQRYLNIGTWGLALVHFQDETTQQVWQEMLRGSDRSGSCYPSLMGYLWPSDLLDGGYHKALNLAYANPITLQALMGPEFGQAWQSRSLELKLKALELLERDDDPSVCTLTHAFNKLLFETLCRELSIDQTLYLEMVEFEGQKKKAVPEIILRSEQGIDTLQSIQVPYRKSSQ